VVAGLLPGEGAAARAGGAGAGRSRGPDAGYAPAAAVVRHHTAFFQALDAPAAGLPLMEETLQLPGQAPPSFDHADALLIYANVSLPYVGGLQASVPVLNKALEIAEAAHATAVVPLILACHCDQRPPLPRDCRHRASTASAASGYGIVTALTTCCW
jgi:hypothetical protein